MNGKNTEIQKAEKQTQTTEKAQQGRAIWKIAVAVGKPLFYLFCLIGVLTAVYLIGLLVAKRASISWASKRMMGGYIFAGITFVGYLILTKVVSRRSWKRTISIAFEALLFLLGFVVSVSLLTSAIINRKNINWTSDKMITLYIALGMAAAVAAWIFCIRKRKGECIVGSYFDVVFLFPLVLVGFLMGSVSDMGLLSPETCAWVWIITSIFCILAIVMDFDAGAVGFLAAMSLIIPLTNYLLKTQKGIDILGDIHRYFADKDIIYQGSLREVGVTLSIVFGVIILCSIIWTSLDRTYKVESLIVRRYRFLRGTPTVTSDTRNADSRYPNLLKAFILLAGDVVIQSPENLEWVIIRNVIGLPFRIGKIRRTLRIMDVKSVDRKPV